MPTFDDFNFGDDSGAVDTDPVPDNDNLDANQSSPTDGVQDDVANYPEPGQDDRFEGGEPSDLDVQGNPNEPGAQQDHIPPASNIRQMFDAYTYGPVKVQDLDERLAQTTSARNVIRDLLGSEDAVDIRSLLDDYTNNPNQPRIPPTMREMLDQSRHAEQDAAFNELQQPDDFTVRELFDIYQEASATNKPFRTVRRNAWNRILSEREDDESILADNDVTNEDVFDTVESLLLIPDSVVNDIFDDESMIALLEEYNNSEASWGRIDGMDDFANTIDNPSGIGELFDQLLVSGHDAFVSIDNSQDVEGLVASDFLTLDAYVEEIDIRDYVGDLTLNSDIIEFQNMGTNVLEDFDGVL